MRKIDRTDGVRAESKMASLLVTLAAHDGKMSFEQVRRLYTADTRHGLRRRNLMLHVAPGFETLTERGWYVAQNLIAMSVTREAADTCSEFTFRSGDLRMRYESEHGGFVIRTKDGQVVPVLDKYFGAEKALVWLRMESRSEVL